MKDCWSTSIADEAGSTCSSKRVPEPVPATAVEDCCAGASTCASTPATTATAPVLPVETHVAGDDCCSAKGDEIAALGEHADVRRVLAIVLLINLLMFFAEFGAGLFARSTALMADSVDMLGDALVYGLSLYALKRSLRWRAGAALVKAAVIASFGVWVFVEVVRKLMGDITPTAETMGVFGAIALVANLACLAMLYRFRNRDVNLSSTFECSRNDVIANTGVLIAAGGVAWFNAGWPDIFVGGIIAILFFRSAIKVLGEAWPQFRAAAGRRARLESVRLSRSWDVY
ncbi:MAG: cation transporter [Caulobacterales bacterium]|nr:cation transporter [Caulobacterales bacterium]